MYNSISNRSLESLHFSNNNGPRIKIPTRFSIGKNSIQIHDNRLTFISFYGFIDEFTYSGRVLYLYKMKGISQLPEIQSQTHMEFAIIRSTSNFISRKLTQLFEIKAEGYRNATKTFVRVFFILLIVHLEIRFSTHLLSPV